MFRNRYPLDHCIKVITGFRYLSQIIGLSDLNVSSMRIIVFCAYTMPCRLSTSAGARNDFDVHLQYPGRILNHNGTGTINLDRSASGLLHDLLWPKNLPGGHDLGKLCSWQHKYPPRVGCCEICPCLCVYIYIYIYMCFDSGETHQPGHARGSWTIAADSAVVTIAGESFTLIAWSSVAPRYQGVRCPAINRKGSVGQYQWLLPRRYIIPVLTPHSVVL